MFLDYLESEPFKKANEAGDDLGKVKNFISYLESKQLALPKEKIYFLKMCDEMQEWDRRYFEISKVDENVFCPNCGSPIISFKEYHDEFFKESLLCRCCNKLPCTYKKYTFFPHRNMYTVTTCHSIDVSRCNDNLIFRLNYRLIDLLHMSQVSSSYASYRAKELNKLKVLMLDQKYSTTNCPTLVQNVYLDYTMSANPIFLKARILIDYLKTKLEIENCNTFQDFYVTTLNNLENIYEDWINHWNDNLDELVSKDLINADNFQSTVFEFFKEKFLYLHLVFFYHLNNRIPFFDKTRKHILKRVSLILCNQNLLQYPQYFLLVFSLSLDDVLPFLQIQSVK